MTMIVWNGCDEYVEADEAVARGHDFDGETLFHGAHQFEAFDAVEIAPADMPTEDDAVGWDGILGTETGKFYRAA